MITIKAGNAILVILRNKNNMDIFQEIHLLKTSPFIRLGLFFITPYNPKETPKIRRDLIKARKENEEADDFIREYIKDAEWFAKQYLPF